MAEVILGLSDTLEWPAPPPYMEEKEARGITGPGGFWDVAASRENNGTESHRGPVDAEVTEVPLSFNPSHRVVAALVSPLFLVCSPFAPVALRSRVTRQLTASPGSVCEGCISSPLPG